MTERDAHYAVLALIGTRVPRQPAECNPHRPIAMPFWLV
jgi:hypothetical protein